MKATTTNEIMFRNAINAINYARLQDLQKELDGKIRINQHMQDIKKRMVERMLLNENEIKVKNFEKIIKNS